MKNNRKNSIFDFDWSSVLFFTLLVSIGIISIYSATYTETIPFSKTFYGKQIMWFSFSLVLVISISIIKVKFIKNNASLFYLIGVLVLFLVLVFGIEVGGNKSWIRFGSFSIQPSEFMKIFTVLGLAKLLSEPNFNLSKFKNILQASILIFTPIILILLQNDLGSAIVFLSLFIVLFREGLHQNYYILVVLAATLFITTIYFNQKLLLAFIFGIYLIINLVYYYFSKQFIYFRTGIILFFSVGIVMITNIIFNKVLKPHQKNRIEIVLGKKKDDKGTGYNLKQALIAISSGGVTGKGIFKGTQTQGDYIPEQHTDWIVTVIGEQWGFTGTLSVVLLYTFLLIRLLILAERQKQKFNRIVGYGVLSIIFFHYALNMLMVLGLFPTIGIPLPLLSYGGSSLWAFTIMLFIFLKLDANRIEDW